MRILWIDAHVEIHTSESSVSKNFHDMIVRMLLGEFETPHNVPAFLTLRHEQI